MSSDINWHVVRLEDVKPSAWRNGCGTTRELFAWPDSQQWRWRASVAEVAQPGAFSSFPGVQRWFAVLSGDGVCLTVDGDAHTLKTNDPPFSFSGAAQTHCELLGGGTQDFNLMVQGGALARMQRVAGDLELIINTPKIIALYAINTPARVLFGSKNLELPPHSFAWAKFDQNSLLRIHAQDALLLEING